MSTNKRLRPTSDSAEPEIDDAALRNAMGKKTPARSKAPFANGGCLHFRKGMKNILTALQWTIIFIEIVGLAIAFSAAEQEKANHGSSASRLVFIPS